MEVTKKVVKEKVEKQEAFEKPKVITNIPVSVNKERVMSDLEFFMARHKFPNGWKREIKEILKPVLQ